MSEHTIAAPTSEAMQELGRRVAGMVHGGDVLLLSGPLGAGKTTFAQGFGAGLDITEPSCLLHSPLPANLTGISPTALRLIWCMWMPTVWAAQPMRRGRTPSGVVGRAGIAGIGRRT